MILRLVVYLLLFFIVCGLVLVGTAAVKGDLKKENLDRLLRREPPKPKEQEKPDGLDVVAQQWKVREEALNAREAQLAEREKRVALQQQDIDQLLNEAQETLKQMKSGLDEADTAQKERLNEVVKSLEKMDPVKAAETLAELGSEKAAAVLSLMKKDKSAAILDEVSTETRTGILSHMLEPKY